MSFPKLYWISSNDSFLIIIGGNTNPSAWPNCVPNTPNAHAKDTSNRYSTVKDIYKLTNYTSFGPNQTAAICGGNANINTCIDDKMIWPK